MVRKMDSDVVVVLARKFFPFLSLNPAAGIWVVFGTGKTFSYWQINTIFHNLGKEKSLGLPFFHTVLLVMTPIFLQEGEEAGLGNIPRSFHSLCLSHVRSIPSVGKYVSYFWFFKDSLYFNIAKLATLSR